MNFPHFSSILPLFSTIIYFVWICVFWCHNWYDWQKILQKKLNFAFLYVNYSSWWENKCQKFYKQKWHHWLLVNETFWFCYMMTGGDMLHAWDMPPACYARHVYLLTQHRTFINDNSIKIINYPQPEINKIISSQFVTKN